MNALIVPAEIAYPSMEKAKNASFAHTLAEGYTLVDLHTRRVDNGEEGASKALILNCFKRRRTNRIIQPIARKRATGSTATECMFRASIREEGSEWKVYAQNQYHDLEAFADQTAYLQGRAVSAKQTDIITRMGRAGGTPSRIVTSLRRNDRFSSTLQVIYNIRAADRRILLAGRTPLVALLYNLAAATILHKTR